MNDNASGQGPLERQVRPLRWMCQSCAWIGNDAELLTAANPFAPDETIVGCPMCKAVDDIVSACDEPGCDREGTCGWPTEDGDYRRTCFEHSMWRAGRAGGRGWRGGCRLGHARHARRETQRGALDVAEPALPAADEGRTPRTPAVPAGQLEAGAVGDDETVTL